MASKNNLRKKIEFLNKEEEAIRYYYSFGIKKDSSVFVGHDHINTYVARLQGIQLGYAGNAGYATYGDSTLQRGARVFEISEANPAAFTTRMVFAGDVGANPDPFAAALP